MTAEGISAFFFKKDVTFSNVRCMYSMWDHFFVMGGVDVDELPGSIVDDRGLYR